MNYEKYKSLIEDNDNVSKTTDVKEGLILVGGTFLIIIVAYFLISLFIGFYVDRLAYKDQLWLESNLSSLISEPKTTQNEKYIKKMQNAEDISKYLVSQDITLNSRHFNIGVIEDKNANAFVYPNGNIYLTTAILDTIKADEELAFIIGHEIAHYKKKHHLKSMGNSLALVVLSTVFFAGQDDGINKFVSSTIGQTSLRYSQKQEYEADKYACTFLKRNYGNCQGASTLFNKIDKYPELIYLLSNHPSPKDRIEAMNK